MIDGKGGKLRMRPDVLRNINAGDKVPPPPHAAAPRPPGSVTQADVRSRVAAWAAEYGDNDRSQDNYDQEETPQMAEARVDRDVVILPCHEPWMTQSLTASRDWNVSAPANNTPINVESTASSVIHPTSHVERYRVRTCSCGRINKPVPKNSPALKRGNACEPTVHPGPCCLSPTLCCIPDPLLYPRPFAVSPTLCCIPDPL
ncbi:unnamed protein product, partial [Ranitomeya imitator]